MPQFTFTLRGRLNFCNTITQPLSSSHLSIFRLRSHQSLQEPQPNPWLRGILWYPEHIGYCISTGCHHTVKNKNIWNFEMIILHSLLSVHPKLLKLRGFHPVGSSPTFCSLSSWGRLSVNLHMKIAIFETSASFLSDFVYITHANRPFPGCRTCVDVPKPGRVQSYMWVWMGDIVHIQTCCGPLPGPIDPWNACTYARSPFNMVEQMNFTCKKTTLHSMD